MKMTRYASNGRRKILTKSSVPTELNMNKGSVTRHDYISFNGADSYSYHLELNHSDMVVLSKQSTAQAQHRVGEHHNHAEEILEVLMENGAQKADLVDNILKKSTDNEIFEMEVLVNAALISIRESSESRNKELDNILKGRKIK